MYADNDYVMEKLIIRWALYTRFIIIILQYFSNILIPDHDAHVFLYPQTVSNPTFTDKIIHHFLGGFVRWDAQYFMHIARYGYTYENTLAFFPLYPLTARLFSLPIYLLFPVISLDSIILLVFLSLNIILFVISAKVLFRLTTIIFNNNIAYKSTLLFCINPASIFFSAPYTECLFCYLTFQSILNCLLIYRKYSSKNYKANYFDILYVLPICLSSLVRSNGVLNIGFLIYTYICIHMKHWQRKNFLGKITFIITKSFTICILIFICLIPFIIYQIYCFRMFCMNFETNYPLNIITQSEENEFILPGQFHKYNQSWCYNKIPLAYSYVQEHYWNVGFLKYYELKQLPQFLLAAPVLIILIKNSIQHLLLGSSKNVRDIFSFDKLFTKKKSNIIGNPVLNVFVIHILFLTLFCALFVHIQVSTRMLCSASPILYWYCANNFKDRKVNNFRSLFYNLSLEQNVIIIYFLSYFFIGTILFCNFLPWT